MPLGVAAMPTTGALSGSARIDADSDRASVRGRLRTCAAAGRRRARRRAAGTPGGRPRSRSAVAITESVASRIAPRAMQPGRASLASHDVVPPRGARVGSDRKDRHAARRG